jgi:hypothetical protein
MSKCPFCQFENEDGALFCEQCKSDLGVTEPVAAQPADRTAGGQGAKPQAAIPSVAVAEVASPLAAVAVAEAAVTEAVPVAQLDAGVAAAAGVPIAVAVPLPETPPVTVAPEAIPAGVAIAEAAPTWAPSPEPSPEQITSDLDGSESTQAQAVTSAAPDTAPDTSSPITPPVQEAALPSAVEESSQRLPAGTKPKLVVLRGQRINVEYPLYEGDNYLGRADEKAVDIDLEDQEPPDRVWSSRQHARITYEDGLLMIEDLNSTNGTFVNRMRVHPGQKRPLQVNDIIQIGTVQLKVKV